MTIGGNKKLIKIDKNMTITKIEVIKMGTMTGMKKIFLPS